MNTSTQDPIRLEWTTSAPRSASAGEVARMLGRFEVSEIPDYITPYMAAAGAELASVADIRWTFGPDDPVVALLRLIARAAITAPTASGPHTQRLAEQLAHLSL